jgi:hypothetical protein
VWAIFLWIKIYRPAANRMKLSCDCPDLMGPGTPQGRSASAGITGRKMGRPRQRRIGYWTGAQKRRAGKKGEKGPGPHLLAARTSYDRRCEAHTSICRAAISPILPLLAKGRSPYQPSYVHLAH